MGTGGGGGGGGGGGDVVYAIDVGNHPPMPPSSPRRRGGGGGRDFRPFKTWTPWLVPAFVVANFVMFAVSMYENDCPAHSDQCLFSSFMGRFAFEDFSINPLLGPSTVTLEKLGALEWNKVVVDNQWWRLLTCIWLHGGIVHILANMLSLLFIGIRLEHDFGFVRIGVLYIISGVGASLLSILLVRSKVSVGASGALFGLLGGMLSELLTNWTIYANKLAALLTLLFIIALNMAVGLLPKVDQSAHIGGFITGFLLGFVVLIRPQFAWVNRKNSPLGSYAGPSKSKYKIYQYILWIVAAILLIMGFTFGLLMLFHGVNLNDRCPWCHYLSCIPTHFNSCKPQAVCKETWTPFYFNLTCSDSGKTKVYFIADPTDNLLYDLCNSLCS